MSALGRLRLPLAAFLAAALGGVGLGLALDREEERRTAPRAQLAPAITTELREAELPATPSLRLGTSPATPSAPPAFGPPVDEPVPDTRQPPAAAPPSPSSGSGGLGVEEETVVSP